LGGRRLLLTLYNSGKRPKRNNKKKKHPKITRKKKQNSKQKSQSSFHEFQPLRDFFNTWAYSRRDSFIKVYIYKMESESNYDTEVTWQDCLISFERIIERLQMESEKNQFPRIFKGEYHQGEEPKPWSRRSGEEEKGILRKGTFPRG